jgi:hypothetical protein
VGISGVGTEGERVLNFSDPPGRERQLHVQRAGFQTLKLLPQLKKKKKNY